MSSIITSTLSGMNAVQESINYTANHIKSPQYNNENQISIENNIDPHDLNPGVQSKQVYDEYLDFLKTEEQQNNTKISAQKTKISQLNKLENLLREKSTLFNKTINDLYNQIEQDIVIKHHTHINDTIEDKLASIIVEMRDFDKKMTALETETKNAIQSNINQINEILNQIQEANVQLACFPDDVMTKKKKITLEKREKLEIALQTIIDARVLKNNKEYKIALSDGKYLINNKNKTNLISIISQNDPQYISVAYQNENSTNSLIDIIEPVITSGSLGALLKFSKEDLYNTRNKIGQLSLNCLDSVNSYHMLGYDQDGELGEKIFQWDNPEVISTHASAPSELVSAMWSSSSKAKSSDYEVTFKGDTWTVKRLLDNQDIKPTEKKKKNEYPLTCLEFDGITLNIKSRPKDGDLYEIRPYNKIFNKLRITIKKNSPFAFSSTKDKNQLNYNNALIMKKLNKDWLVNQSETLDESYKNYTKSVVHKRHILEENLKFKEKLKDVFIEKKKSMANNIETDYKTLSYQQKCYIAHTKVLKMAEKILNELLSVSH
ncbi:FlgK family flagellar hook-associated protein [Buchnera aphidicola]|uniref:FlgK family flagellar hook-associated protein n=1 Tax=Buchnera aphidicola TaxID=9 RepID=UPI0034638DDF